MPKVCVEIPQHILDDLNEHIGDDKKFVNLSDAIRTACRKSTEGTVGWDRRGIKVWGCGGLCPTRV